MEPERIGSLDHVEDGVQFDAQRRKLLLGPALRGQAHGEGFDAEARKMNVRQQSPLRLKGEAEICQRLREMGVGETVIIDRIKNNPAPLLALLLGFLLSSRCTAGQSRLP